MQHPRGSKANSNYNQAVNNSQGFQRGQPSPNHNLVSIDTNNMQQAQSEVRSQITPFKHKKMNQTSNARECIKVCVRVRPLLPREMAKEEVVYYPSNNTDNLEGIKVADGQHLIESKYDKVYSQRTH